MSASTPESTDAQTSQTISQKRQLSEDEGPSISLGNKRRKRATSLESSSPSHQPRVIVSGPHQDHATPPHAASTSTSGHPSATPRSLLPAMDKNALLDLDPSTPVTNILIPQSNVFSSTSAHQPTTSTELSHGYPSALAVAVYPPSSTSLDNIVPPVVDTHPALELGFPPNPPAASLSLLEGAKDCTLNNPLINNVAGDFNATIFKFDGDVPRTEELKSLFASHIAGTGQRSLSPAITSSMLAQPSWKKDIIKCGNATLKVLGGLTGIPSVHPFVQEMELVGSSKKALEKYCGRLMQLIKPLMEGEGCEASQELGDSLNSLHGELFRIYDQILKSGDEDIDFEKASREIRRQLESFLLTNHIAGCFKTAEIFDNVEQHELSQAINNLPRAKAAFNDYLSPYKRRAMCFGSTRQALLRDISEWVPATDKPPIYVLSGLAGIGKSAVAQTVAARCHDVHSLGASFFFSRGEADRRNAEKFFTTIAYQLCVYNEEFARAIGSILLTKQGSDATTKDPGCQLESLILNPLRDIVKSRSGPIMIVVDALDECDDEDASTILAALNRLVQELSPFRIVLTTRPQLHLQDLDSPETHKVFYLQNIEEKIVDGDIRLYLKHSLSQEQVQKRLKLRQPWSANFEEIDTLVRGAGRLFIIASTSVLFILDTKVRNPGSQMKKLRRAFDQNRTPLNALNDFYTVILRSALPVGSDSDTVKRFQTVIGTVVLAKDPIPIEPLAELVGLDSEDVYAVLDNLQPVISLSGRGETPHIYHKSFPDYLTDATRCKDMDLCIVPKGHHTRIIGRCFQIMNAQLRYNILDLGTPRRFMKNDDAASGITDTQLEERIPLELRYACIYWANHLESADIKDTILVKDLELFGNEHLLHWIEVLSWLHKLNVASRAIDVSTKLLKSILPDMGEIFRDALRFVSRFYSIIQQSALHTYYSALSFTPPKSVLYSKYRKDTIHNLCELDGVVEGWDALISSFVNEGNDEENDLFSTVAFLADSSRLASWEAAELKLWDATNGTPVKTFKGRNFAIADNFSVIAISKDTTVTLRNAVTNAVITVLPYTADVIRLALSFDGTRFAAGLSDGTVRLWDMSRGEAMGSLDGYDGGRLEFSPSGYRLAYVSAEGGIKLWDGATRRIIANLDCGSDSHMRFSFSRDGSRFVSLTKKGHEDRRLRLWNTENGELIGVAEDIGDVLAISDDGSLIATGGVKEVQLCCGNSLSLLDTLDIGDRIYSLAFSPGLLAIGCYSTVKLYDLKSRAFVVSVPFPETVDCLSISPDCTRLAAAGGLWLQLWDVPSLEASYPYSGRQPGSISALAFSLDCSRLASGSTDGTVKLWDTLRPCQPIATHDADSERIAGLGFSPDGGQLASVDKMVRFWDGRDGVPIGTLEHYFPSKPRSVAFSNILLAVATTDNITLWDRETLRLIQTLDGGSDSLSFSLDGSLLASALYDQHSFSSDVKVWGTEEHTLIAAFRFNSISDMVILSPDGSQLAVLTDEGDFTFLDINNKCPIQHAGSGGLTWVPNLNGVLISSSPDNDHLFGRYIDRSDSFPVLCIPRDVDMIEFALGSSAFALGCQGGQILIGRASATCVD